MTAVEHRLDSEAYRRLRGASYRGQVLLLERMFVEARKLTEVLVGDPVLANAKPGTAEMHLSIRLELMHARALIATDAGEEGRRLLVSLYERLVEEGSTPLLVGPQLARVLNDLAGRLSLIGEHSPAVALTEALLAEADPESERASRLATVLASRRLAAGFERECSAALAASADERAEHLLGALALYEQALTAAEQGVAGRAIRAKRRATAIPALLLGRAVRTNARMRAILARWWLGEADLDDLRSVESEAWELAQESRDAPGVLQTERIWRLGSVGIVRAVRAEVLAVEDRASAHVLAERAQDLLAVSYRARKGTGTVQGVQTSNAYGRVLFFLGDTAEGVRVFAEAADHAEKRFGVTSPVARVFRMCAVTTRPADMGVVERSAARQARQPHTSRRL